MIPDSEAPDSTPMERPRRITAQGRTFGKVSNAPSLVDVQAARYSSEVGSLVDIVAEALERTSRRITGARKRVSETS